MTEMRERNLTRIWLDVCEKLPSTHWFAIEFTQIVCKHLHDYSPPKPISKGSVSWTAWRMYLSKAGNWMVLSTTILHFAEEHVCSNRFDHNPITSLSDREYAERVMDDLLAAEQHPEASVRHSKEVSSDIINQFTDRTSTGDDWKMVTPTPSDRIYALPPSDIARRMDGDGENIHDALGSKKRSRRRRSRTDSVPSNSDRSMARGDSEAYERAVRSNKIQAVMEFETQGTACDIEDSTGIHAPEADRPCG